LIGAIWPAARPACKARPQPSGAISPRAEMDLAVALSACPAATCNGGPPRPLGFEILAP